MCTASTKLHKSKNKMNIPTFYSLSTGILSASIFNIVGTELAIEAKSRKHAVLVEFIGNNNQHNNAIRQKLQIIAVKFGASYLGRCLGATTITYTFNNALLGYQIKTVIYVAGFFFLYLLPKVLTLAPYIGHVFRIEEKLAGKVLHASTITASIVIFPMLLLNSTTVSSFTFVALTGYTLYIDVFKKVL